MSDIEKNKLAPCPFCGGNPRFQSLAIEAVIFCELCKSKIIRPHSGGEKYRMLDGDEAVIEAWNTRPAASVPSVDEIEELIWTYQKRNIGNHDLACAIRALLAQGKGDK